MSVTEANKAYIQLKEKVITLELPPGSVIRESQLMAELGLGRTPIREALMQLEAEKLVVVAPRRGMFVADIAFTDLQQIYEIRIELESLCARLATVRITPEQLAELSRLVGEYQQVDKHDKKLLITLDRCFHYLLAQASGNRFLRSEIEMFYNLSLRIWHLSLPRLQPEDLDVSAHVNILSAIQAQDGNLAGQIMAHHIGEFHNVLKLRL